MPTSNNEMSNFPEGFFDHKRTLDKFRNPPHIPNAEQTNGPDMVASRELGKLAAFLMNEFPVDIASGKTAVEVTIDILTRLKNQQSLSPSEALYGFMGWLVSRQEEVTFSGHHDASIAVELLTKFIEKQKLSNPRNEWANYLISMNAP